MLEGRKPHPVLSVTHLPQGRIERRQGSWCYYQAHRKDGHTVNFARKRDAVAFLERVS